MSGMLRFSNAFIPSMSKVYALKIVSGRLSAAEKYSAGMSAPKNNHASRVKPATNHNNGQHRNDGATVPQNYGVQHNIKKALLGAPCQADTHL